MWTWLHSWATVLMFFNKSVRNRVRLRCEVHVITAVSHPRFIHSFWITATAQAQSKQLHPSPAPRVGCSSRNIKTRAERCCGLCMWASVVRMALNLQLPACLSLCFCASLSLPSSWTFSLHVAVSLRCFLCWNHTVPLSLISFFSLTFSNLPLFLLKQMHKCTVFFIRYQQLSCFYV